MPHTRQPSTPEARRQEVLSEIARRSAAGHPLNSGANRGDWLYAAAVRFFGSWAAAVESAGFDYGAEKQADLSADEVLNRIRRLAATEQDALRAGDHPLVAAGARRHFGGWRAAFEAAGCTPPDPATRWTSKAVVAAIREDVANGLPVNSVAMVRRNGKLYVAGRRRFGSWAAALVAAEDAPATKPGSRRPPRVRKK
jgi:hypothetical protein